MALPSLLATAIVLPAADEMAVWNGTTGSWSNAARWSTSPKVPANNHPLNFLGTTYDVFIGGGSVTQDIAVTIENLTITNGTVTNTSFPLVLNAGLDWVGGSLSGTAAITVAGPSSLGSSTITLNAAKTVTFNGPTQWGAGDILLGGGGTLVNAATQTFTTSGLAKVMSNTGIGGASTFNNQGTFVKSGSATTTIRSSFNNSGVARVDGGGLILGGGGTSTGAYTVSGTNTLRFDGGTHTLSGTSSINGLDTAFVDVSGGTLNLNSGTYAVAGTTSVIGGTLNFGASGTTAALIFSDGTIGGAAAFSASGPFNWTGGMFNGTGAVTIAGSSTLSGGQKTINAAKTVTLDGPTSWTTGSIALANSGTLVNAATRTMTNSFNGTLENPGLGGVGFFTNAGTFVKNTATGATTASIVFNNNAGGVLQIDSGTLNLTNSGTHAGTATIASGATILFSAGSHAWGGGAAFSGAGTLALSAGTVGVSGAVTVSCPAVFSGGTLNGSGELALSGPFTWSGTALGGTGPVNVSGPVTLSGGNKDINGAKAMTLNADTTWSAGDLRVGGGGTLSNAVARTFANTFDGTMLNPGFGGAAAFNNAGRFVKNTAAGTTTVSISLNNTGTISVESGTLVLSGGGSSTGAYAVSGANTLRFGGGTHTLSGTSSINGLDTAVVDFSAGALNFNSGTYSVAGTTSVTGGTLSFGVPGATSGLTFSAGTIGGAATFTASGPFNWTGGTFNGTGAVTLSGSSTLSGVQKTINASKTVTLDGPTSWTAGSIALANSGTLVNAATRTMTNSFNGSMENSGLGGVGFFTNAGTFVKNTATGTTTASIVFNNNAGGILRIDSGTLSLMSAGTHAGTATIASGATILFSGGSHTWGGGAAFGGAGTLALSAGTVGVGGAVTVSSSALLSGGTLNGAGTLAFTGPLTWSGTTLSGTGAVTASGPVTLNGGNKDITGAKTVTLDADTAWNAGDIRLGAGAVLVNAASRTMTNTAGASILNPGFGGSAAFTNAGTFLKNTSATATTIAIPFTNTGAVEVAAGILTFTSTLGPISGSTLTGGAWRVTGGTLVFPTAVANIVTNQGTVVLDGPTSTFAKFTTAIANNQGSFTLRNDRDLTTAGALANSGTVRVEGSPTLLTVNGAYTQSTGSTTLVGGAQIATSSFNLNGGTLAGTGTINGPLVSTGAVAVSPGSSAGTLTVTGNASLSGTLTMELGGMTPGAGHDQLLVGGNLQLGGTLALVLLNGFVPTFGQEIVLADGGSLSGAFTNAPSGTRLFTADGLFSFIVNYGPTSTFGADKVVLSSFSDQLPPVLGLPDNLTREATGPAGTPVTFTVTAIDAIQGAVVPSVTPESGSTFPVPGVGDPQLPLGVTTVVVTASDVGGNTAIGSFTVNIVDTTAPTLTIPTGLVAEATGPTGAVVAFATSATDLVDSTPTVSAVPASGSLFPLGSTTVTVTAVDDEGNTASQTFVVSVVDTTPPVLSIPSNITLEATGPSGAVGTFTPSAVDSVSGVVIPTSNPTSGSTFPLGTTTVMVSAQDAAGNTANGSFTVNVVDTTAPVITAPANLTVEATGPTGAVVSFAGLASDTVDLNLDLVATPTLGSAFALGTTAVTLSATDDSGNASSATFTVTVVDTTAPVITAPANMTVAATDPSGAVVTFALTAQDAVDGAVTPTSTPASGSRFPIGATSVTVTAADAIGNIRNATFTVTVTGAPRMRLEREDGSEIISTPLSFIHGDLRPPFTDVGRTSEPVLMRIVSVGTLPLEIRIIDPLELSVDFTITSPSEATLLPGEAAVVEVRFNPTTPGIHKTSLTIASNALNAANVPIIDPVVHIVATGLVPIEPSFVGQPVMQRSDGQVGARLISAVLRGPRNQLAQIQVSNDLGRTDDWQTIGSVQIDANGDATVENLVDPVPGTSPTVFFRVHVD